MNTLIETLRDVLGIPQFWVNMPIDSAGSYAYQWDYGSMLEYSIAGILICLVVSSVFKFLRCLLR